MLAVDFSTTPFMSKSSLSTTSESRISRLIAFYLPQFHPIPENDEWWNKGFTEWTNVAKAKPLFVNHYQPRLPADLGFYDLRVPETRLAQAEMAEHYGIEGFCYWHYWFAGKRLLEKPFNEILRLKEPDFPFCLAWANQSWSGIWHGCPDKILIRQTYPGIDDYRDHFYALLDAFGDARYLTIDNKPIFLVYQPHALPDSRQFTDC
jgi:lipopolysaccharide biosynthesis protein